MQNYVFKVYRGMTMTSLINVSLIVQCTDNAVFVGVPTSDAGRVDRAGGVTARVHTRQAHTAARSMRTRVL